MKLFRTASAIILATLHITGICRSSTLEEDWQTPPPPARLKAYWWWLNGNVTREAIKRDLTEMKAKGFGGAVLFDAGGAEQRGNAQVPHGATFLSPEWRELFRFTLETAKKLDLEISLNIQSGWNLGGPMVGADDAPKKLTWSQTQADGGMTLKLTLPKPPTNESYYRDLRVLAYPLKEAAMDAKRKPLDHWREKALLDALHFSAPDTSSLVAADDSKQPPDALTSEVIDITDKMKPDGSIEWTAPVGSWEILRMGVTLNDHCHVSTSSEGWSGYAIDPFDDGAFRRYWDAVVEPLLADAKPYEGKTLKYLHTDSWEVEVANWTPTLREEFRKRRGYDLIPWLPVIAGRILDDRDASNRFLDDLRRTMGDLAIDHHFRLMKEGARKHGLLIHPESGGPHAVPIDAQQCLGFNDAPMSEFWAWSWTHRIGNANRYFVKQPAMAAHTYGRNLVMAEGFTTIGPHWQERLCDNLKPSFDHACTEGLNQLVWHAFVCSPASEGIPGQQYFAGSHLNPNVTWWEKSGAFFSYINRCQALLQRGLPVSDIAYYYGHHVPNFAQLRESDPAKAGPGFDYDVVTEEVLTQNMEVENGRLILPHGVSYRALVLPPQAAISIQALRKIRKLAEAGALIIGPAPDHAAGLDDDKQADLEVADIRKKLWSMTEGNSLIKDQPIREVLQKHGITADVEFQGESLDWVHRREDETEIYFLANAQAKSVTTTASFRVKGMAAELWDPVTTQIRAASGYGFKDGRTLVPLTLAEHGSVFVIFRKMVDKALVKAATPSSPALITELQGPWKVSFDPKWGGPSEVDFPRLVSWTDRPEPGICYYSGTAKYRTEFKQPKDRASDFTLDLGDVREMAEVYLNGKSLGIVWAKPYQLTLPSSDVRETNTLEIEVVNFWPNRIIGDQFLPNEQRFTRTNIRAFNQKSPLMPSGLLGPVKIISMSQRGNAAESR